MSFLNAYKKYLVSNGASIKDSLTQTFIKDATSSMKTNPSYFEVSINGSEELTPSLIVDDSKSQDLKEISLAPNYTLRRGDYIEWDKQLWIVLIVDNQGDIYHRGRMEACAEETLKWIDESGVVRSYPCVFYYGAKANFGTYADKIMAIPDGRRQIVVQKNEHTVKLNRNRRFLFGGNAFIVIDHDYISDDGLVHLNLKDDLYNPARDNVKKGIADYFDNISNFSVKITNGDSISIRQSQSLQINVVVSDGHKTLDEPEVQFSVIDEDIATIDENGLLTPLSIGRTTVRASYEEAEDLIDVLITDSLTNNYSVEITGDGDIRQSMSKTFKAIFRNNGVPISETAYFTLTDTSGLSTELASITSQSEDSCVIKAGTELGTVKLHVQNQNGLIKTSRLIQVKSLLSR